MKVGYLGPNGTFSEQAVLNYSKIYSDVELIQFPTIRGVLDAVENGIVDEGVVPFENSIEGVVTTTIDGLIFDDKKLYIKSEVVIGISQNLLVRSDYNGEKIERIISHPQGIAQCDKFLRENFKDTLCEAVSSTGEGARIVSESKEFLASISPKRSAEIYGLKILKENIQDDSSNQTRFVVVTNESPKSLLGDKTSIVFTTDHKPGELYKILDIFAIWDINMTKIESRPMKHKLGTYCFFIDVEAENKDDLRDALKMVERKTSFFRLLGSYTRVY